MANSVGAAAIPPSGRNPNYRESPQVIINSDLVDAKQAVNDHFTKSIAGQNHTRQWQEKNLPEEFFSKPSTKSSANTSVAHSRDGSTDSSGRSTMSPLAAFIGANGQIASAIAGSSAAASIQHIRTQSSPATLNTHMSLPPNGQPYLRPGSSVTAARSQQKHRSVDNTLDSDQHKPLPYGWERKFTENGPVLCQPYRQNANLGRPAYEKFEFIFLTAKCQLREISCRCEFGSITAWLGRSIHAAR